MKLIKIEYEKEEEDYLIFELFDNIEKAFKFTKLKGIKIRSVELVDVNEKNIYYDDGELNYEDNSELFIE